MFSTVPVASACKALALEQSKTGDEAVDFLYVTGGGFLHSPPISTAIHRVAAGAACGDIGYAGQAMNSIDSPLLGLSQRLPPSNLQAEQALLGALLANNRAYERVSEFLAPEHFADPVHGRIYQAIARRVEAGQLADAVMLKAEFDHAGVLDEVGGTAYLAQLLSAMVGIINAGDYGRAVHDAWLRRQLIDIGETVVNNAFGAEPELDGVQADRTRRALLFELAKDGDGSGGLIPFSKALQRRDRGRRARVQPAGSCLRPGHRAARPRQEDGRAAPVRPADPCGPAGHGQDRRWRRRSPSVRPRRMLAEARAAGPERGRQARGCAVFAGNECRAARHPPAGGGVAGVGRSDPPRRHQREGLSAVRRVSAATSARCRWRSTTRRRSACRAAHAVPAVAAHQGVGAGGGGLSAADAAGAGNAPGKPRAGDQPDHAGPEGDRQGACGAGAGAVAAVACGRGRARTSDRNCRICASRAPSSRTPTW